MPAITSETLHRVCRIAPDVMTATQARSVLISLGGFARWCVEPSVFQTAALDVPGHPDWFPDSSGSPTELPTAHGSCWMPVVVRADMKSDGRDVRSLPALRAAFPFPFRWVSGTSHSPRLPPGVRALAEQILCDLHNDPDVRLDKPWGLQLPDEECGLGDCDFSGLTSLSPDSGWVPLTAGLLTAIDPEGSEVNPSVWSTGAWAPDGGVIKIDGARLKAMAAAQSGAVRLYVPQSNYQNLISTGVLQTIQLQSIRPGIHSPSGCLKQLVADFNRRREPPADDSRQSCEQWFQKHPSIFQATEFYRRRLIDLEVARCHDSGHGIEPGRVSHIVSFLSNRPELTQLTLSYCGHKNAVTGCLLFYTHGDDQLLRDRRRIRQELVAKGLPEDQILFVGVADDPSQLHCCRTEVQEWMKQNRIPAGALLFDLTPGKKWMTLALVAAAPSGSRLLYWQNENRPPDHRIVAGSEVPFLWTAGTDFSVYVRPDPA